MLSRFSETSSAAAGVFLSTSSGYPPPGPGYQAPPPGYQAPPPGYVPPPPTGQPSGLSQNAASALCYLFGLITGIIFLVLEPYKRDRLIRFHAFQSIFLNLAVFVVFFAWNMVAGLLDVLSHGLFFMVHLAISSLLSLGFFILWVILLVRALQGTKMVLPVIGPLAERQAGAGPGVF